MAHPSDVAVHGRKRPAEGELEDQRLTKRLGRLQIGNQERLCLREAWKDQTQPIAKLDRPNDPMMLDDTESTVYIHDLEQELAEIDILGPAITIIPGLEDRLSVTKMLVADNKNPCNDIVLYREPESLTIPKDKDQVRQALIETRERARLAQQRPQRGAQRKNKCQGTIQGSECIKESRQKDNSEDEMDIDARN
ncbi:hypothetical protein BDW62DRAFT_195247 [Aspergillus aurantiobrunneus]